MSEPQNITIKLPFDSRAAVECLRKMATVIERMATSFGKQLAKIRGRYVLVVPDPADEHPTSFAAWVDQAWAILRHDFWMAAGQPERAPGAHWERRR